jgi:hypothetical protein
MSLEKLRKRGSIVPAPMGSGSAGPEEDPLMGFDRERPLIGAPSK